MNDKFDALLTGASLAVSVLTNADVTDIEMLPLKPFPLSTEEIEELARQWQFRGLRWFGAIGIVNGQTQCALSEPIDAVRIEALSAAFVAYCEGLLGPAVERVKNAEAVSWLEKLHSLEDPRRAEFN